MNINFIFDSIINAADKVDYICHQVNCQGAMRTGVAKSIRDEWPEVYEVYSKMTNSKVDCPNLLLGHCQYVPITQNPSKETVIINMFAQEAYGYDKQLYTNYSAFQHCLKTIKSNFFPDENTTIAFPYRIGCDRGGANWKIIYTMIEETFKDINCNIYFYAYGEENQKECAQLFPNNILK